MQNNPVVFALAGICAECRNPIVCGDCMIPKALKNARLDADIADAKQREYDAVRRMAFGKAVA